MEYELAKVPFFFAAGFSAKENTDYADCVILNRLVDHLYHYRFAQDMKLIKEPELIEMRQLVFSFRMSTPIIHHANHHSASIDAKFLFTLDEQEERKFSMTCESVDNLCITDLSDPSQPRTETIQQWCGEWLNSDLNHLYRSLAHLFSCNLMSMKQYFYNVDFEPKKEIQRQIEIRRRLSSAYSMVNMRIFSNGFEVDKDVVVRSVQIQKVDSSAFMKLAYKVLGSMSGFHHAVIKTANPQDQDTEQYEKVDLDNFFQLELPEFYMSNHDQTTFLKINSVTSINLKDLEASKIKPQVIDLDQQQRINH